MRQFLVVAFLTVLAFAAGYGVRIWVDSTRPLPAPPPLGAEFADGDRVTLAAPPHGFHATERAALAADIAALMPQIEAFSKRQHEIDKEFDKGLQALLTPKQHEAYVIRHKRNFSPPPAGTGPLTDQDIHWLREQPFVYAVDHISVAYKLDDLDKDFKFTPEQREQVRQLLNVRRDHYIALVDNVYPPSLSLINLAHMAQRLGAPPAAAAAAEAKP